MDKRHLGSLEVSAIGLGCMGLSANYGEPVDTASLGPAAAEDPMLVFELTDQVRETIQQTLYSVLVTRRSVFF